MLKTIEVVKKLLTTECDQFEYVERYRFGRNSCYGYGRYHDDYDDYDDDFYGGYSSSYNKYNSKTYILIVTYQTEELKEETVEIESFSLDGAWFSFFKENPTVCWNDILDFDYDFY